MYISLQMRYLYHLLVFIYIWTNVAVIQMNCYPDVMSQMKNVRDKIFKGYDKYIRPTNGTNTTEVQTYFHPRQIIDLDENKAIFIMDSYFVMRWFDPRLMWNKSDYDGVLQAPRSMMWVPDVSVFNSHSVQVDPTLEVPLVFTSDGWIWWVPPVRTQTSCASISRSQTPYPKDEVECDIIIGSWLTHGWEVDFKHSHKLYLNSLLNIHPRWELIKERAHTYRNETYYDCCPEPYISIHVVLPMRRRTVPEIEATRSPCILVLFLTLSIFWLPPNSNKKLVLGGFLFVVLNILLVYVSYSTKAPLLVTFGESFLQRTMHLVVTTMLLQIFIVIKIASQTGPSRPPSTVTHILSGPVGKYIFLPSLASEDLSTNLDQLKENSLSMEKIIARDEWSLFAAATDRALFILMALIMIVLQRL